MFEGPFWSFLIEKVKGRLKSGALLGCEILYLIYSINNGAQCSLLTQVVGYPELYQQPEEE